MVAVDDDALQVLPDRRRVGEPVQLLALDAHRLAVRPRHHRIAVPAGDLGDASDQVLGHDHLLAGGVDHHVVGVGRERHGGVRRQRPGGGGPDEDVGVARDPGRLEHARHAVELEGHEDGGRHLVAVLDLGLGERRVAVHAPVDRLAAAVDGALQVHVAEQLDVARLVVGRKGEVRVVPVGVDAEPLEALSLHVDVLGRPRAAELAQLGQGRLRHPLGPERLLDHVLDWLAVAVPTRDVGGEEAALRVALVHEVLEDLVEGVADVDGAVRIGRPVVQHEGPAVLVLFQHLPVDALPLPLLEPLRLVLREVPAHGEIGLGKVHRVFVVVCHFGTNMPFETGCVGGWI